MSGCEVRFAPRLQDGQPRRGLPGVQVPYHKSGCGLGLELAEPGFGVPGEEGKRRRCPNNCGGKRKGLCR